MLTNLSKVVSGAATAAHKRHHAIAAEKFLEVTLHSVDESLVRRNLQFSVQKCLRSNNEHFASVRYMLNLYAVPLGLPGNLLLSETPRLAHAALLKFRACQKYHSLCRLVDMEQLLRNIKTLLRKALKDVHFLHHLLPELKTPHIQLRPANHNHHLPICKYELYKRSFIVRSLFNFDFNYQ